MNKRKELSEKVRNIIYDYIYDTYGEFEAYDPSWYIPTLAEEIVDNIFDKKYKPKYKYRNVEEEQEKLEL